jgi:hypothetical protein
MTTIHQSTTSCPWEQLLQQLTVNDPQLRDFLKGDQLSDAVEVAR